MDPRLERIRQFLIRHRQLRTFYQSDLGKVLGISQQGYAHLESEGAEWTLAQFLAIVRALEITGKDLLDLIALMFGEEALPSALADEPR